MQFFLNVGNCTNCPLLPKPECMLMFSGKSENLKGMLRNQHLRAMMENLVNSIDPMADMEDAMQEPIFVELADECLRIVEGDKEPDMASVSK